MKVSTASIVDEQDRHSCRSPITACLRAHAAHMDMMANYDDELERKILNRPVGNCDQKTLSRFRRTLKSTEAYKILALIWKESDFVSEADLSGADLKRLYPGKHLTAHGLAVVLAETPLQVSRFNTRIRAVGLAAATFELIDRNLVNSKKVILRPTKLLNEFMVGLGERNPRLQQR